jgi:negative regulator of sigma E activity
MDESLFQKLNLLEQKIQELIKQNFELSQKISNFEKSLTEKEHIINQLYKKNEELKTDYNKLKIGKAIASGSKTEDTDEAKKTIEKLIKEINLCIAELNE